MSYDWPGNIRELENVLERAVLLTSTNFIRPQDLPSNIIESKKDDGMDLSINEIMKNHIKRTLLSSGGNKTKAAFLLGISRRALQRKLVKYKLDQ